MAEGFVCEDFCCDPFGLFGAGGSETDTLDEDGGDTLDEDEMAIWCSSEVSLPCSH